MVNAQDERIATLEADARIKAANLELAQARVAELEGALLDVARRAESLKRECRMDPESPQAIRNAQYMGIAYAARAAMKDHHD